VPIRADRFDYTHPIDGSDPATDWKGLHPILSLPNAINPSVGWAKNTNNWPWTAAGPDSPKAKNFPRYMDEVGENARGIHADLLLKGAHGFTPQKLRATAFDSFLPAFAELIPQLVAAYDALPAADPRRTQLAGPIALLKPWNDRWGYESEPTSLAVFWGDTLWREVGTFAQAERMNVPTYIAKRVSPDAKLAALGEAADRLTRDFGSWRIAWGRINRFQRIDDAITSHFDDAKPSIAVPFTSSQWGSLASFGAKSYSNTKKYYGTSGNSFVAIVEFGPTIHAWGVTAGGESGDPGSSHFRDEIRRYADGDLRPIYFYPSDLKGHTERTYAPGD
jgi:acyl-homoserine lactone acylase PvdQ